MNRPQDLLIENATILGGNFRNFEGRKTKFSSRGDHFFHVRIDAEIVDELRAQGFTIKELPPREEGDLPLYFLKVKIKYECEGARKDPEIRKGIAGGKFHLVGPDEIASLDQDEIEYVDLVVHPSHWHQDDGTEGYTAYVKEMYVTIAGSRFASKYDIDPDDEEGVIEDDED